MSIQFFCITPFCSVLLDKEEMKFCHWFAVFWDCGTSSTLRNWVVTIPKVSHTFRDSTSWPLILLTWRRSIFSTRHYSPFPYFPTNHVELMPVGEATSSTKTFWIQTALPPLLEPPTWTCGKLLLQKSGVNDTKGTQRIEEKTFFSAFGFFLFFGWYILPSLIEVCHVDVSFLSSHFWKIQQSRDFSTPKNATSQK